MQTESNIAVIVLQEFSNNSVLISKMEVMTDYLSLNLQHIGHFSRATTLVSLLASCQSAGSVCFLVFAFFFLRHPFLFALCFFVCIDLFGVVLFCLRCDFLFPFCFFFCLRGVCIFVCVLLFCLRLIFSFAFCFFVRVLRFCLRRAFFLRFTFLFAFCFLICVVLFACVFSFCLMCSFC